MLPKSINNLSRNALTSLTSIFLASTAFSTCESNKKTRKSYNPLSIREKTLKKHI